MGETFVFFDGNELDVTEVTVNGDGTLASGGETGSWFVWNQTFVARTDDDDDGGYAARFSPDGTKAINAYWESIPFTPSEPGNATYRPVYLSIALRNADTPPALTEFTNTRWIRMEQTIIALDSPSSGDNFLEVDHSVDEILINNSGGFSVTTLVSTDDPDGVGNTFSGSLVNSNDSPEFDVGAEVIPFPPLNASRDLAPQHRR